MSAISQPAAGDGRKTAESAPTVPTRTPPSWLNAGMRLALRTPGLQSWIGRSVALIGWTGRRSGRRYTTPVGYHRGDGTVTILSRRSRRWWRNFDEQPRVELRLAGETVSGRARASLGQGSALPSLIAYLEHNPRDAEAYGVRTGRDGRIDERDARALLNEVVVVEIALD